MALIKKNIKIATVLPYKENYTFNKASAASLWVSEFYKKSLGANKKELPMLPIIPLGVHDDDFNFDDEYKNNSRKSLGIEDDDIVMDVGQETRSHFSDLIREMNTVIWNGPLGVFEFPQFAKGTESIALAVAESGGFSIAGGGETVTAIDHFSVRDKISYISTGGGAFLEYVQGIKLPAVQILEERVIGV